VPNYIPISSLTSFSKIFEKIYYRLIIHITFNQILTNSQFGFRRKSSRENAAYKLTDDLLTARNEKKIFGGIFFDLEKAFVCIDHDILLTKLEYCGINSMMCILIKSYLEDR
jgi:hypothetical protein